MCQKLGYSNILPLHLQSISLAFLVTFLPLPRFRAVLEFIPLGVGVGVMNSLPH